VVPSVRHHLPHFFFEKNRLYIMQTIILTMLVTRLVSPLREDGDSEDEDQISPKWIEDHERKLFWALWTPSIAAGKLTGKFIQELQALARQIHERRLASLYVEVNAAAEVRLP
jgi:hypothetical protein